MVVVDILGVVNEVPVPREEPPVGTSYQEIVPAEAVADNATVPASHLEPAVVPVIVGALVTVAITDVLVAVVHPPEVAST